MPVGGEDFFQFVKGAPQENQQLSYFPTYAHLVSCAAMVGLGEEPLLGEPVLLDRDPRPIPLEIFENQNLLEPLLLAAIVSKSDATIARDKDAVARLVERLASSGFVRMQQIYEESGPQFWLDRWEDLVVQEASTSKLEADSQPEDDDKGLQSEGG